MVTKFDVPDYLFDLFRPTLHNDMYGHIKDSMGVGNILD